MIVATAVSSLMAPDTVMAGTRGRRLRQHVQRLEAAEAGQIVVDQHDVPVDRRDGVAQTGLRRYAVPGQLEAGVAQPPQHQLGVVDTVFHEENAQIHLTSTE